MYSDAGFRSRRMVTPMGGTYSGVQTFDSLPGLSFFGPLNKSFGAETDLEKALFRDDMFRTTGGDQGTDTDERPVQTTTHTAPTTSDPKQGNALVVFGLAALAAFLLMRGA